jgi:serine/threonine protein kinase
MLPLANRVLGQKYRLVRPIDAGGMASVWLAEHLSLSSTVAVKLLSKEVAETEEGAQRFLREARMAASLRSPHVVQTLDYGVDAGTPYIVMELLEGESLADRLRRVQRLSPAQTELVLRHVARAVGRAHDAGIVHRDLKPANIFIVANDEEELVKVLDFGIAKASGSSERFSAADRTRTGAFLGTPGYVSPEQAEGVTSLDYRTDIWSFGVIAYECLLGRPPFVGESFGSLVLAICSRPLPVPSQQGVVPPGFDGWFARACARAPEQRLLSAREASSELRRLLDLSEREASTSERTQGSLASGATLPGPAPAAHHGLPGESSREPATPFSTAGVTSSSGVARRARWSRSSWALLGAALVLAALVLLARGFSRRGQPLAGPAANPPDVLIQAVEAQPPGPLPSPEAPGSKSGVQPLAAVPASPGAAPRSPEASKPAPPQRPAAASVKPADARARAPVVRATLEATPPAGTDRPAPPPAAPSRAPSINLGLDPPPASDCNPPWDIDANGNRRLKPQCL